MAGRTREEYGCVGKAFVGGCACRGRRVVTEQQRVGLPAVVRLVVEPIERHHRAGAARIPFGLPRGLGVGAFSKPHANVFLPYARPSLFYTAPAYNYRGVYTRWLGLQIIH